MKGLENEYEMSSGDVEEGRSWFQVPRTLTMVPSSFPTSLPISLPTSFPTGK